MTDNPGWNRWRLVLGKAMEETSQEENNHSLTQDEQVMDQLLESLYGSGTKVPSGHDEAFNIARWLTDVRRYFSRDVVSVVQEDAIERKGWMHLLLEPEALRQVTPDLHLVSTLMVLKDKIPDKSRESVKEVIRQVVDELNQKLANEFRQAVTGALNRKERTKKPNPVGIDFHYTIKKNLRNYDPEMATIVPEQVYFYQRKAKANQWHIILAMDQSGSMASSMIYGSVMGCIMASINALRTEVVAFDTRVVNLSREHGVDPVEMIFGLQLGGGTDINKAVTYCRQLITHPEKTLFILLSDLEEGGDGLALLGQLEEMKAQRVKVVSLLALTDEGKPEYNETMARKVSQLKIPCFACTPRVLPQLVEGAIQGSDLTELAKRINMEAKTKAWRNSAQ